MLTTNPIPPVSVDNGTAIVTAEAARRRSFAVISHPDAGKSTLTEALALHAHVIGQAGAVHGKAGRRGTVSDWMEMERSAESPSPPPRCSSPIATTSSICWTPPGTPTSPRTPTGSWPLWTVP